MNLNSREAVVQRLRRGKTSRQRFVESNLAKAIAHQLRATRDKLGWSQERLAREVGMNQNAISRLESPAYGKQTLTTLKRLGAAMDVALIVRFVPFSELIDWISGTPRKIPGLTAAALAIPDFESEEKEGVFAQMLGVGSGPERHLAKMPVPLRQSPFPPPPDNTLNPLGLRWTGGTIALTASQQLVSASQLDGTSGDSLQDLCWAQNNVPAATQAQRPQ